MMRRTLVVSVLAAALSGALGMAQAPARVPDYPAAPVPIIGRDLRRRLLGAAAGDGPQRHDRRDLQAERDHRADQELRDRRTGRCRRVLLPLRVRRLRRLQDHRGSGVRAGDQARPVARRLSGRADCEDRQGAGARRLPLHRAHHRSRPSRWRWRARSGGRTWSTATNSTTSATCTRRRSPTSRPRARRRC